MGKQSALPSNSIRTTKYTLLSWAPLSLFFQFTRVANVYFLIISILTAQSFSPKVCYIQSNPRLIEPDVDVPHLWPSTLLHYAQGSL